MNDDDKVKYGNSLSLIFLRLAHIPASATTVIADSYATRPFCQ